MATVLSVTTTATTVVTLKPQVKRKLLTELKAYQELKIQRDALDAALAAHKVTIGELREGTGETSLSLEGFKVSLVSPVRSTLDKRKLLEQGVTMGQIQNATVTKPTRSYEKVTCPGEKEVTYE